MQRPILILAVLAATFAGPALAQTDTPAAPPVEGAAPPLPPGGDALAPAVGGEMPTPSEAGQGEASMHDAGHVPGSKPEGKDRMGNMGYGSMMGHPPISGPMPGVRIQMGQGRELDLKCGETGFADCLQAAMPIVERFMAQP